MEKMNANELLSEITRRLVTTPVDQLRVKFNSDSDEVLLDLSRNRIRAVSIPIANNISVRVAPDRSAVLGLHFENFTSAVVRDFPKLVGLLDVAETSDYSDHAIMDLRRRLARDPGSGLTPAGLAEEVSELLVGFGD